MGLEDRDYWREWKREQGRHALRISRRSQGVPAWILWPVLLCVGVLVAKFLLDWKRAVVPFPPTGTVHWYVEHSDDKGANLTLRAPIGSAANFVVRLDSWEA